MQQESYKEALLASVKLLVKTRHQLYDQLFELAVTGELQEWAASVPVGESHTFTNELFEALEDTNVQTLMPMLRMIEKTAEQLCTLNGLPFPEEVQ